ncbi:chloride channel protein [Celeribacter marinus]|uniref:chloride channel protein n=1 Tax=Celeribacter marinus TaxID=1397108 RepID=UPI0014705262|nr:chloride channel protein [Celeribacter marinus]
MIGAIVAIAAAAFVNSVKYFAELRKTFSGNFLTLERVSIDLTLTGFITGAAILILLIRRVFDIPRWYGPADTIYAAHQDVEPLDLRAGLASTLVALISACGAASVGQYGPLVHFGATAGAGLKKLFFVPMSSNVVIGCGVAAAISAGFNAPIAGIIFAHEAVLRHFSPKAMAPIATSAIVAAAMVNYVFQLPHPLTLRGEAPALIEAFLPIILASVMFGLVAVIFMISLRKFAVINKNWGLKPYQSLSIAVCAVVIIGSFVPNALGLGTDALVSLLNTPQDLSFIATLLLAKIILTSICLGFGFFGGVFSPALLVGAASGALLAKAFEPVVASSLTAALTLAGMASVAACVVGAPLATVFIVLELTLSYEFTLITLLAVIVSQVVSSNIFGHSFFDRQLMDRGIDLRFGRNQLSLNQTTVAGYATCDYIATPTNGTAQEVMTELRKKAQTEAYCLTYDGNFVGKITINQLLDAPPEKPVSAFLDRSPLTLNETHSMHEAIEIASSFVGESIPVVSKETGKMLGVLTEADLFAAYLKIQDNIRAVER